MVVADQPQEVGAAPLAPAEIARVIDDTGEVGILEVHPDRQHMSAAAFVLDDTASEIGPVSGRFAHFHALIRIRHPLLSCAASNTRKTGVRGDVGYESANAGLLLNFSKGDSRRIR